MEDLDVAPVAGALRHSVLSAEDERAIARRAVGGDRAAREQLVQHNYRLVAKLARRYAGSGVPLGDLFQEGVCGLIVAAAKYDARAGTRFATYATWWIRSALQRAIRLHQPVVLSQPAEDARRKVAGALGALHGERDVATVAGRTGLTRDATRRALALHALQQPLALDAYEVDRTAPAVEEQVAHALRRRDAERLIAAREPREQTLLRMRFGFDDDVDRTLAEIARALGSNRETTRLTERRLVAELADCEHARPLRDAC